MRLKRCIVASVLVVSFCLPSPAQQSVGGSIAEEVVKTALERNQEFLAARERVVEAEALLRQAGIRPVPTISGCCAGGIQATVPAMYAGLKRRSCSIGNSRGRWASVSFSQICQR